MLTDENIEIIESDIETMKSMTSKADTELFIMKLIRDRLFDMGIEFHEAAIASSYSNFVIDFNLDSEEDVEMVTNYINEFVDFSMRRALSLTSKGRKEEPNANAALECFQQMLKKNQIKLI